MDVAITWDAEVSGLHAELQCVGGEAIVVDDGLSRNGTFLNGQRVTGRARMRNRDQLRLGRTVLAFRTATQAPAVANRPFIAGYRTIEATQAPACLARRAARPSAPRHPATDAGAGSSDLRLCAR